MTTYTPIEMIIACANSKMDSVTENSIKVSGFDIGSKLMVYFYTLVYIFN